jgi:hypothetical protein
VNPCHKILAMNAGAVECRRNRASGTIITLYRADEAGMENDPELPWCTVCEDHGAIVCHGSRELAKQAMPWPDWCEQCQEIMERRGLYR